MKYQQLKHILHVIKHNTRCPECKKMYPLDEVDVVDLFDGEGVIDVYCPNCKVGMSLTIQTEEIAGSPSQIMSRIRSGEITNNEVENISRTLQSHRGGLQELFNHNSNS